MGLPFSEVGKRRGEDDELSFENFRRCLLDIQRKMTGRQLGTGF